MVNEGSSISDVVVQVIILGKMSQLKTLPSIIQAAQLIVFCLFAWIENDVWKVITFLSSHILNYGSLCV